MLRRPRPGLIRLTGHCSPSGKPPPSTYGCIAKAHSENTEWAFAHRCPTRPLIQEPSELTTAPALTAQKLSAMYCQNLLGALIALQSRPVFFFWFMRCLAFLLVKLISLKRRMTARTAVAGKIPTKRGGLNPTPLGYLNQRTLWSFTRLCYRLNQLGTPSSTPPEPGEFSGCPSHPGTRNLVIQL